MINPSRICIRDLFLRAFGYMYLRFCGNGCTELRFGYFLFLVSIIIGNV